MATLGFLYSCVGDGKTDYDTDENAARMQLFVEDISAYAKGINPDFIIIPQNGAELAYNYTDPDEGVNTDYIDAIDGFGIEELFYNADGVLDVNNDVLGILEDFVSSKKVMVSDYVPNDDARDSSIQMNKEEGFISFPRIKDSDKAKDNYDYKLIPSTPIADKYPPDNIITLVDAQNYLYLISTENFADKNAMLTAIEATNYDVVLIDLFFNGVPLTKDDIIQLKTKHDGGKRLVIAYVSIGSAENYRYYWKPGWRKGNPSWIKKDYEGYPDEYWVEYWNQEWQDIIYGNDDSYIKKIIDAGFDGAYLDNVEAYYFLGNN